MNNNNYIRERGSKFFFLSMNLNLYAESKQISVNYKIKFKLICLILLMQINFV